jgi:hypothetical protein
MSETISLPTTWEIKHTDPAFPGQVLIKVLGAGTATVHIMTFEREVFLDFAEQIDQVAKAMRQGVV